MNIVTPQEIASTAPRWEYCTISRYTVTDLNTLGREGWELVTVVNTATTTYSPVAYLKRRLPNLPRPSGWKS